MPVRSFNVHTDASAGFFSLNDSAWTYCIWPVLPSSAINAPYTANMRWPSEPPDPVPLTGSKVPISLNSNAVAWPPTTGVSAIVVVGPAAVAPGTVVALGVVPPPLLSPHPAANNATATTSGIARPTLLNGIRIRTPSGFPFHCWGALKGVTRHTIALRTSPA